jgi:exonuclease III
MLSIQQEEIPVLNMYVFSIRIPKIERKYEWIGHPDKKNSTKKQQSLNCTLNQIYLTDIYRKFNSTAAKYTFFSSAHGTFSSIGYMTGHKISLNKFLKIEIISHIFQTAIQ